MSVDLPPVSYVIPVLNEAAHLAEAVASVLGQDYPAEQEVVIALGTTVMDAGEKNIGRQVELTMSHHPGADEPEAYERVLTDAMEGDQTLFARQDYVEEAWRIVDSIVQGWKQSGRRPDTYAAGTWGPTAADALLGPGRQWRKP